MRDAEITRGKVSVFTVPTDQPESDGTIAWSSTTMILVELEAGGLEGMGYSFAHASAGALAKDLVEKIVIRQNALDIPLIWDSLVRAERNLGRVGLGAMALSAIDNALWDLKAKLLGISLVDLLGAVRREVPIYGSGGFTSYSSKKLIGQLQGWVSSGIPRVKMKIGLGLKEDLSRVSVVRKAIGEEARLFVDANEAYQIREALTLAERFVAEDVTWFEQPIQAEDLPGMHFLREKFPSSMQLTTGEYLSDAANFRSVLLAGAADVLQPDITRCRGVSGFLKAAALCESFNIPVSSHCAPSLHVALGCHLPNFLHLEYFYDHARIEKLFFDGVIDPVGGKLTPDFSRPGFGLELKKADIKRFAA